MVWNTSCYDAVLLLQCKNNASKARGAIYLVEGENRGAGQTVAPFFARSHARFDPFVRAQALLCTRDTLNCRLYLTMAYSIVQDNATVS